MTTAEAIKLYKKGKLVSAEILPTPGDASRWFVLMHNDEGKSFILVEDNENVISVPDLDGLIGTIREIGFRIVSIRL